MRWLLLGLIAVSSLLCGCVERRVYLRSNPPGADVYLDGEFIGTTRPDDHPEGPLYANFVFYGQREYTFRKAGYTTVGGTVDLEAPWYEYPPIDFFAEVLVPWRIVDDHVVDIQMRKAGAADVDSLYENALEYRYRSRPQDRYEYAHGVYANLGGVARNAGKALSEKPPKK